jgi:hypothetical protein
VIPVNGELLTVKSAGRRLTIRPDNLRLSLRLGDAEAALAVRVVRSSTHGCAAGTGGSLKIADHAFGSLVGTTTAHLVLPRSCGGSIVWPFHAASINPVP